MEQQNHLTDLTIDPFASQQLRDTAKWGKFLSIISFIACILMVVAGVFSAYTVSQVEEQFGGTGFGTGYIIGLVIGYSLVALVWFIPSLFLFQSSNKVRIGLDMADQQMLNEGLTKLKACFRFFGIVAIIFIALFALGLLVQLTRF